jgi:hypothetical protein
MLQITAQAADHLRLVRSERGLSREAMPKFARRARRLTLTFADRPMVGDRVVDPGTIAVLVAPSAADLFEAGTIDVDRTRDRPCLVVRRRRASNGRLPRPAADQAESSSAV